MEPILSSFSDNVIVGRQEFKPPVQACFQVTFNNWSRLAGEDGWKDKALPCCEVPCLDFRWKLHVHPESSKGIRNEPPFDLISGDHLSAWLHVSDWPPGVSALEIAASIALHSQTGAAHSKGNLRKINLIKKAEGSSRGWEKFISHEELRNASRGFIVDDAVRFNVCLCLTAKIVSRRTAGVENAVSSIKSSRLSDDFLALMQSGRGSDVVLNAGQGGGSVPAHRTILMARSSVFSAMFEEGKFAEGAAKAVCIKDMDVTTLRALVCFLYTAEFPSEEAEAKPQSLLIAADKYDLQELKQHCELCLERSLEPDCVAEVLVVADSYHCSNLKVRCLDLIKNHTAQVMAAPGWTTWLAGNAPLLNEVVGHIAGFTANGNAEGGGKKRGRDE